MDPQVPQKGKKPTTNLTSGLRTGTSRNLNVSAGKKPATSTMSSSLSKSTRTQMPLKTPGASTSKSRPLKTPVTTRSSVKTTTALQKSHSKPPVTQATQPSSSTSSTAQKPPDVPTRTTDELQIAAQVYPWTYMSSALETCFHQAEVAAQKALEARAKELSEEEADIADQRIRFETERIVAFYEQLSSPDFGNTVSTIVQGFLQHGDSCTRLTSESLRLANQTNPNYASPLKPYDSMLTKLDNVHAEGTRLETSIVNLLESSPSEVSSQSLVLLISIFSACLPILRARTNNIRSAHELVKRSKENAGFGLEMESLRLTESQ